MENRHGLLLDLKIAPATGKAECEQGLALVSRIGRGRRKTVGADKGYDTAEFVSGCWRLRVTPHVARKRKYSTIDGRTTHHKGHKISQVVRRCIEPIFGWIKEYGGLRRSRFRGVARTQLAA